MCNIDTDISLMALFHRHGSRGSYAGNDASNDTNNVISMALPLDSRHPLHRLVSPRRMYLLLRGTFQG